MGIEQTMDFGISTETKNSRQKKDRGWQTIDLDLQRSKKNWGRKIMGFGQIMDLIFIKKYKIGWVLNELWIWFKQNISKRRGRKIMGIEQTMDLKLVKK